MGGLLRVALRVGRRDPSHQGVPARARDAPLSAAELWGGASYERLAATFAGIHEHVVAELAPRPAEDFLDLACGTGGVALLAASSGARVVGLDLSEGQLSKARAAAAEAGLEIRFDEGDCLALPYEDRSFDAVASTFGMVFATDQRQAASELARVCRPGARIVLTAWPDDEWSRLGTKVGRSYPPGDDARDWAREPRVVELLGDYFELGFEPGEWRLRADSSEELWDLLAGSAPLLNAWLDGLEPGCRAEVDREFLEFLASGELCRDYLTILGTRR